MLVALGHDAAHLQNVRQIVGRPGGQKLARRHQTYQFDLFGLADRVRASELAQS